MTLIEDTNKIKEIIGNKNYDEAKISGKLVMISINKSYTKKNIYEATRYAWREKKEKIQQAEMVLSTVRGFIVGVYKPTVWYEVIVDGKTRVAFDGEEVSTDISCKYIGKRVPEIYRKRGHANPIKYSWDTTLQNTDSNISVDTVDRNENSSFLSLVKGYLELIRNYITR